MKATTRRRLRTSLQSESEFGEMRKNDVMSLKEPAPFTRILLKGKGKGDGGGGGGGEAKDSD